MDDWEVYLMNVQDIVDIWMKVQGVWLYLEPIFSSEDIMKQLPTEGTLLNFQRVWFGGHSALEIDCFLYLTAPEMLKFHPKQPLLTNLKTAQHPQ